MKIGIDIDEVVVEFFRGYLKLFNKKFGTNYSLNDWTSNNIWEFAEVSKEKALETSKEFSESKDFNSLEFVSGAKESISFLEDNNEIFFITSRPDSWKKKTISFFEKNFPKNNFHIYFSGEISGGKKSKGEICEELGLRIMVEDNGDYALDCAKRGIKTFLLDKPWNKDYEEHENIIKVSDWGELVNFLGEEIYEN